MIEITKAILGVTILMCGWLSVQMVWQRVFANSIADGQSMFGRCGCKNCCRSKCQRAGQTSEKPKHDSSRSEQTTIT
jgi:hypothetical protein